MGIELNDEKKNLEIDAYKVSLYTNGKTVYNAFWDSSHKEQMQLAYFIVWYGYF